MRFKIYFTTEDGSEDSVVIEGRDETEVRENADAELKRRGGTAQYSEEI